MKIKNLIYIVLFLLVFLPSGMAQAQQNNDELMCGPKSFKAICDHIGVEASMEEITKLTEFDPVEGTSMLGLYKAAVAKGLQVVPMKLSLDALCNTGNIGIVHINGNHFMVFLKCDNTSVLVQNPPNEPVWVTKLSFTRRWGETGSVLLFTAKGNELIASEELKVNQEPDKALVFQHVDHDFGNLEEGTRIIHEFPFKNTWTDTLKITTRSTCDCAIARLTKSVLAPGEKSKVKVILNTHGYPEGELSKFVFLKTDVPEQPVYKLTISTQVIKTIEAIPSRLWLGDVSPGETIFKEVLLRDPLHGMLEIESISAPDNIAITTGKADSDSLLTLIPLIVSITPQGPPGKFEHEIVVHTNIQRYDNLTIPVGGIIESGITSSPSLLYFGDLEKGQTVERDVTVTVNENADVRIKKASASNASVSATLHSNAVENGQSVYHVKVAFTAPDRNEIVQDTIQLYADGTTEPVAEIPLYAHIAK